jgi:hypothetical protein
MSPFSRAIAVSRDARGGPPDAVFFDTLRIPITSHPSVRNDRCELRRAKKEFLKAIHLQFRVSLGIIKDDSEAVRARIHLLGELRSLFSDDSLKGNPAGPGASSKTKPTWSKPRGRSTASAFFFARLWSSRGSRKEKPDLTAGCPIACGERPRGVHTQALVSEDRERQEEKIGTESEPWVTGLIADSWVEFTTPTDAGARVVLQVALRGKPEVLIIVEA